MYINETNSTNALQHQLIAQGHYEPWVRTDYQTAGRGQEGTIWESERGKNLLVSYLLPHPNVQTAHQFELSMRFSLAVCDVLRLLGVGTPLCIKWPNDIYYGDSKLGGILIENIIAGGQISYAILGLGLNVNQLHWCGEAPNPISLAQILHSETGLEKLCQQINKQLYERMHAPIDKITQCYRQMLYRREGWHKYVERSCSVEPTTIAQSDMESQFEAELADVDVFGRLQLRLHNGETRLYHFKQVRFVQEC